MGLFGNWFALREAQKRRTVMTVDPGRIFIWAVLSLYAFLGWTLISWVIARVWAMMRNAKRPAVRIDLGEAQGDPASGVSVKQINAGMISAGVKAELEVPTIPVDLGDQGPAKQTAMSLERRHHSRTRLDLLVPVDLDRDNGGIALNLSEGGLRIRVIGCLENNQLMRLGFSLLGKNHRIETLAQITWIDESRRAGGLQFIELPESSRQQLQQWLALNASADGLAQEATATQPEAKEVSLAS